MSLKQIASIAGVSEATVSLVMNNREGVGQKTRERILAIADEIGYVPNRIAQSLATRKNTILGLVVTDIENPFYSSFTRYINDLAKEKSYSLLISISYQDQDKESEVLNTLISQRVAGIIIAPIHFRRTSFGIFKTLKQKNVPYVLATSYYGFKGEHYVMTDYAEGSYKLTSYLLSIGHRKIIHIVTRDLEVPIVKYRIEGYRRAYADMNIPFDESMIVTCNTASRNNTYQIAKQILCTERVDAIITINDIMAIGVVKAAKELGIQVPQELSIAGYDDIEASTFTENTLTTVRQDIPEIARQSMNMLVDLIEERPVAQSGILLPAELILRTSTCPKK